MFGNFIYFIVVLLIYLTHQPSAETNFSSLETLFLFLGLLVAFAYVTWFQFKLVERRIHQESFVRSDQRFNSVLVRQSILAILLFAVDLYGLNVTSFFLDLPIFTAIPTLLALGFLGLFVGYLAIVWTFAHSAYQKLYRTDISTKSYVLSNISFAVPILLPWIVLSGVADVLRALPFEPLRKLLATTEGEIVYFLIFLLLVAVTGPALIQKFWRCTPLESGPYRSRIESLCRKAGLEYADILYWPIFGGKMITAGVMGLIKRFRYILVTNALLQMLQPEEIDAVIAHEIGHIKRKHLIFYLGLFVGYMLLSYVTFDLIIYSLLYAQPVYWLIGQTGWNQTTVISSVYSVLMIAIFLMYFRFLFGFFMRNFERQADAYVYSLFDTARPLITTLEKIAITSGQPADRPNWHHFSIKERIDYLKKCEVNSSWISRQDRKIRKSIAAYLAGILLVGGISSQLNIEAAGNNLDFQDLEKIVLAEIEKSPQNANLYSLLGDLYYGSKNYKGVEWAYERSLRLEPNNVQVLNNLAWLYATCEDERLRSPDRALELARRAVSLEPAAYVLDTLAESFYVNGMFLQAVQASEEALAEAKTNRTYYQEQLSKFRKAAEATTGS
jgi:Zn-dependent protease with chaperone function